MSKNYVRINNKLVLFNNKLIEMPDVEDIAGTVDAQTEMLATLISTVNDFTYVVHNDTTGDDSEIIGGGSNTLTGVLDLSNAPSYDEVPDNPTEESDSIINVNGVIYVLINN